MATWTPNLNLYKPDASDLFANFRTEFNDNMDKIDNGGGGGSGGHTIYDPDGNALAQENGLQFTGSVNVTDDSINGRTVVDISGGGGNVYGAFVDTDRILASGNHTTTWTYTATEDCFVVTSVAIASNTGANCTINGVNVAEWYNTGALMLENIEFFLKKGQVFAVNGTYNATSSYYVYGLTQGTNGIFAPVIYSDVERCIGVWRDNKPLYQKTIVTTYNSSATSYQIDVSALNLETIGNAILSDGSDNYMAEGGDYYSSYSDHIRWYYERSIEKITIEFGNAYPAKPFEVRLTLQYTKTTDVAGSGNWNTDGVPTHHYSTSEQVVGTYFGKPLYEKTWDNVSIGINGDNWVYFNDPVDIDNVISFAAYWNNTDGYLRCAISEYQRSNSNGIMFSGFNGMNRTVNRIVAQYTKTTDT